MEIPETAYWSSYYKVTGFPTVYVNGPDTRWNYGSMSQVNSELAEIDERNRAYDSQAKKFVGDVYSTSIFQNPAFAEKFK